VTCQLFVCVGVVCTAHSTPFFACGSSCGLSCSVACHYWAAASLQGCSELQSVLKRSAVCLELYWHIFEAQQETATTALRIQNTLDKLYQSSHISAVGLCMRQLCDRCVAKARAQYAEHLYNKSLCMRAVRLH
jgi:hypothetical protein